MIFLDIIADSIKKPISIFDCACGGGATLIAAAHEYKKTLKKRGLIAQEHIHDNPELLEGEHNG